jgi:hypothetical protein
MKKYPDIDWSKHTLSKAIAESYSLMDALRKLIGDRTKNGHHMRLIHRYIKEYNIDISHFGSHHERTKHGTKQFHGDQFTDEQLFIVDSKGARRTIHDRFERIHPALKCEMTECSVIDSWNNKPIILQLDHINGIDTDCRLTNLRWLCPNCHSQTSTFGRGTRNKPQWPSDAKLLDMNRTMSATKIAKQLNISTTLVSKRIIRIEGRMK